MLRDALREMGKGELVGASKRHLIPHWQPAGTGDTHEGKRTDNRGYRGRVRTQHTGLPPAADGTRPAASANKAKRRTTKRR